MTRTTEIEGPACGSVPLADGSVRWTVWAPRSEKATLVLLGKDRRVERAMTPTGRGYFTHTEPVVGDGQRYLYRLDTGKERPDPESRWQPDGVCGPSAVFRPGEFAWTDRDWRGVARAELVVYELHVGTFAPEGTFDAVIPRLPELRRLGVTAVEIMPVGQFPGGRNWGYDGVFWGAAQNSYGGPQGLQRLVDACHAHGLAAILDVVYNHLGPEGSYHREFGPYFANRYHTPWGDAVNYDGPDSDAVRDGVLHNARSWLEDFHFDGLRLDAVHAVFDLGPVHLLRELQAVADGVGRRRGWPAHLVAESDLNDPRVLLAPDRGGYGLDAQWADDFHHAAHAFLTGERHAYYSEYGTSADLAVVFNEPFLRPGIHSPYRRRRHGARAGGLSGERFVVCVQNHDQVGNRARGDRLSTLTDPARLRLAASLMLFSPYLPLVFMGEEYGETNPFPFFCSFCYPGLVDAVRKGRKEEFAAFAWQGEVPDPQAEETFRSAVLSWNWDDPKRAGMRRLYAGLLAARRRWPALRDLENRSARILPGGQVLELVRGGRSSEPGETLTVYFNLTEQTVPLPARPGVGEAVLFRSDLTRYGGSLRERSAEALRPFETAAVGPSGWPVETAS
jgi:maltooligosyltrehalose trehalohydrolase